MSALTIPLALVQARRNPVRTPVRNLSITQGDDAVLELSCFETDSGTPLNLTGAVVSVAIYAEPGRVGRTRGYRDYPAGGVSGLGDWRGAWNDAPAWQGRGVVTQSLAGLAEVELPGAITADWLGRYAFDLRVDTGRGGVTQARGVLQVLESDYRQPARSDLVPIQAHDAIYGTFIYPSVSINDATFGDPAGSADGTSSVLGIGVLGLMVLGAGVDRGASAVLGEGILGRMALGQGAANAAAVLGEGVLGRMVLVQGGSNSAGAPELGVGQLGAMVLGGPAAPPAPAGSTPVPASSPAGTANQAFTFTQVEPRAVWLIRHNFTRRPVVETVDLNDNPIEGSVDDPDATTVVVMFSEAVSGRAYLS